VIGPSWATPVEGKRPSFFKDLQFLLIGPLWLLAAAYRRFSVPYEERRDALTDLS